MAAIKKLAKAGFVVPGFDSYSDELLSPEALSVNGDFHEYSFSGEPAIAYTGLTSGQKVDRLDLNALGRTKKCLPRYLFRAYGPSSGATTPKGQHNDLNSEDAITPHAFIDPITGHDSASEIPNPKSMINGHIYGSHIRSEFSSWTPSLLLVLCYAEQKYNEEGSSHVCVVDTYKIPNGVFHLPHLFHIGLANKGRRSKSPRENWEPYPEEYLVHHIVSGKGYVVLSYNVIRDDLLKVYPEIRDNETWGTYLRTVYFAPYTKPVAFSQEHIDLLKGIAQRFDTPALVYPLTISLICLVKRFDMSYNATQLLKSHGFDPYAKSLNSIIEHTDVTETWLLNDLQFTKSMTEVKQTKTMMRALVRRKFGRGVRTAEKNLAAMLEATHIDGEVREAKKESNQ